MNGGYCTNYLLTGMILQAGNNHISIHIPFNVAGIGGILLMATRNSANSPVEGIGSWNLPLLTTGLLAPSKRWLVGNGMSGCQPQYGIFPGGYGTGPWVRLDGERFALDKLLEQQGGVISSWTNYIWLEVGRLNLGWVPKKENMSLFFGDGPFFSSFFWGGEKASEV